ncbi:MAG: hypothetical protein RLZZ135_1619 [Cyanobacteriota bacterium]|jgi:hypothetical protein
MRIDRLLVVSVLTLCVITGCKGKKEEKKPPATQINSVPTLTNSIR